MPNHASGSKKSTAELEEHEKAAEAKRKQEQEERKKKLAQLVEAKKAEEEAARKAAAEKKAGKRKAVESETGEDGDSVPKKQKTLHVVGEGEEMAREACRKCVFLF